MSMITVPAPKGGEKCIAVVEVHGPRDGKKWKTFTRNLRSLVRKNGGKIVLRGVLRKRYSR